MHGRGAPMLPPCPIPSHITRRSKMPTLTLNANTSAWNVDGSSSSRPTYYSSHIKDWTKETGRAPGICSYVGCTRPATVGGHIWLARLGVYIAPICDKCNYAGNNTKVMGAGAQIKAGVTLVDSEYTEDMQHAERRYVSPEKPKRKRPLRTCEECDEDISCAPAHHRMCRDCFMSSHVPVRTCDSCGEGIDDAPAHHRMCRSCFMCKRTRRY